MPFKIGDRVRILPGNLVGNSGFRAGSEHTIVALGINIMGANEPLSLGRLDVDYNSNSVFLKGLELVNPEPHFEVGKAYRFKTVPNWMIRVTNISKEWMICTDLGGYISPAGTEHAYKLNVFGSWEEVIPEPPKPVHKVGWLRIYPGGVSELGHIAETSVIYATEEQAKTPSKTNSRPFTVAKVEWDEAPEASEDDTI